MPWQASEASQWRRSQPRQRGNTTLLWVKAEATPLRLDQGEAVVYPLRKLRIPLVAVAAKAGGFASQQIKI